MQTEINSLENSLQNITVKYELAQKEIAEHILAMNSLVDLCKNNEERCNSA